ncbi:MAG TPA: hypothetical protein VFL38_04985 [Humibacillus xanthopallidus]|nr:hypothetical protein [Humibacillus xanthopallidus]
MTVTDYPSVALRLREQLRRREPDQVALMHLGAVDATLLDHDTASTDTEVLW